MKITIKSIHFICLIGFILFSIPNANAQLLKKLQKKAEETVERKLEQKVEKETGKTMDTILNPNENPSTEKTPQTSPSPTKNTTKNGEGPIDAVGNTNVSDNLEIYSKFDYVPGDKLLFFDDFSQDFIGDFPSRWNTNASGEVVKFNKVEGNWFELKPGYGIYYIPDIKSLPEDYTLEFDILTEGLSQKTSSNARLTVYFSDNNLFDEGAQHYVSASLPFGQYGAFDIRMYNYFNRKSSISSYIKADIRNEVKNQPHIAISVTKNRYRLWVNEVKYVDIPRLVEQVNVLNYVKFHINNLKDGEERIFIRNLKLAEGGQDLRRELLSNGKVSTNGILFDSGSANIQPQSYGIIRQISQVLQQDAAIKLNIVGHTDSDGSNDANLKLSKARAEAVKNALIKVYSISSDRLQTDGKGASAPVNDNTTPNGKAQNRRVEFIKI
ncbi:OmpA family protein [Confluentibacter citreus]|uniref:OmpA family protein n=1 Tax=Confluentibacter citreus TaxID=2007307 RepID=UPI000C282213|nr:OmpA family protein [Confluentibacter citreus]